MGSETLNMHMTIRNEQPQDIEAISRLTEAAFRNEKYSSHTEHFIVNALRRTGQLPAVAGACNRRIDFERDRKRAARGLIGRAGSRPG